MPQLSKNRVTQIGDLVVDAFLSESHQYTASATNHKVERGSPISDHISTEAATLSIEGIVTDTPIGSVAIDRNIGAIVSGSDESYSAQAEAYLRKIFEERELVTIETSRGAFKNMACTSLSVPVDASTGYALKFSATFTELQIVDNIRVRQPVGQKRAAKRSPAHAALAAVKLQSQLLEAGRQKLADTGLDTKSTAVLWRKGSPPGSDTLLPKAQWEYVEYRTARAGFKGMRNTGWVRPKTGQALTPAEVSALDADLARDLGGNRGSVAKVLPSDRPRRVPPPSPNLFGGWPKP